MSIDEQTVHPDLLICWGVAYKGQDSALALCELRNHILLLTLVDYNFGYALSSSCRLPLGTIFLFHFLGILSRPYNFPCFM